MVVALVGNQNSGKSTLFNLLTGANQRIGNFPGVTVEEKVGSFYFENKSIEIIDLPGIYSLNTFSQEENITRDYLLKKDIDVILNIVDATNLERNLYLTLQLMDFDVPLIVAVNLIDEAKKRNILIDIEQLEKNFCVKFVPISAKKEIGIKDLCNELVNCNNINKINIYNGSYLNENINKISKLINENIRPKNIKYLSISIIENSNEMVEKIPFSNRQKKEIYEIINDINDNEIVFSEYRYNYLKNIIKKSVINNENKKISITKLIDDIVLNKYLAYPILFLVVFLVFFITFGLVGTLLSDFLLNELNSFVLFISAVLNNLSVNTILSSLVCDGIINGLGSVLIFMPTIVVLFFFLSLIEDLGYMSRITFIMDKPLRMIGLSGKSFMPLFMGFGCSVPAVMAARTLNNENNHNKVVGIIPYMSCSAKLPVYSFFAFAFFGNKAIGIIAFLYLMGIVIGIYTSFIIKNKEEDYYLIEMPPYRFPKIKTIFFLIRDKVNDFLKKAFGIIFLSSLVVWFLQSFNYKLEFVYDNNRSLLAGFSKIIQPLFLPIGISDWRIIASLITGLISKENIVSTLAILLDTSIESIINPIQASSILIFILLYAPCFATFAIIKKELNSFKLALKNFFSQMLIAYLSAFFVYNIWSLLYELL